MDPALAELIEAGDADDQIRVVARTATAAMAPSGVEVVSKFGDVATWSLRRGDLRRVWEAAETVSVKAPRDVDHDPVGSQGAADPGAQADDERRPPALQETGRGVIVACLDWGVDFAHPDFLTASGTTRLLALWDQRGSAPSPTTPRYGYGVVHDRAAIDVALAAADPYAALGYHPADADLGHGSHGTHCLSIAAGAGRGATPAGVAPEADLLFVHLDSPHGGTGQSIGDWVTLLDALDFCLGIAGTRPIVISMSLGAEGGPHDGSSLVERALDFAVSTAPGRAICQSSGNYYHARTHTSGRLRPGQSDRIGCMTTRAVANPHQVEVWYAGADRILARIESREHGLSVSVAPGESQPLMLDGVVVGRIHHRTAEPNNGKNHINAFLYPAAPEGRWELLLEATDVADGRYHCWVERESGMPGGQSHLDDTEIVKLYTTNSVCNGLRTITVGAYDGHAGDRSPAPFSSSGPTSDGRTKPDVAAPGVQVLAARSTPRDQPPADRATRMSGTSMAAPYVAGTVALMFEAAGRPLTIAETRRHLSRSAETVNLTEDDDLRLGDGYVDIERAVAAARPARPEPSEELPDMTPQYSSTVLGLAPAELFDALRSDGASIDATVLAGPGARLSADPRAGDILISRVRGELDRGRVAVLHDGAVHAREHCRALGEPLRDSGRGLYVHVIDDGGEIVAIRMADSGGRLPLAHMLIRPGEDVGQGAGWEDALAEWAPESAPVAPGRLVIDQVPLLSSHVGTHPDLILKWNAMPADVSVVDVVVHFHGWSGAGANMKLDRDKEPVSGLDFSNPDDASDNRAGRTRPTLCILPRGNFVSGRRYTHPALITPTGLQDLISFALDQFASATGARPAIGRQILTAHSGGGAGLLGALRHNDPHEVHIFDALYNPADRLAEWARRRLTIEEAVGEPGALRIVFLDAAGTDTNSRAVAAAIAPLLAASSVSGIADRYRAQVTNLGHPTLPRPLGWLLLADSAASLPVRAGHPAELALAEVDDDALRAQWDAHPRVHGYFDGGADTYVTLAPLFAGNGIADAAAYLEQNIITAHFLGHSFPAHRALAAALSNADSALAGATPLPDVHSIWAVNARPIRGRSSSLSKHALGLAVDINPNTNPLIRAGDDRDVVRVIAAVTGVDLGATQPADASRQASLTFQATYGDPWLAARRQELDAATQAGDTNRANDLRATLAAAGRRAADLRRLAQSGFFDLDQRLIDALTAAGLTWGGSWRTSKDFMHFELNLPAPPTQAAEAAFRDDVEGSGSTPTAVPAPPPTVDALSALEGRYFPPPASADAAPSSRAATYRPIIDGRDYFAEIEAKIGALAAGDVCYIAGWWFDPGFTFADTTKLGDLLVAKAALGVDVRVVVWANRQVLDSPQVAGPLGVGPYVRVIHDNIAAAESLRARTSGGNAVLAGRVLIDWSGNAASSHHQKFIVIFHSRELTAFVGGIDFQQNRLSPPMHMGPGPRWHDAGVLLGGDGAARALDTFVTRWSETSTLSAASYDVGAGAKQYNPAPIVPLVPPAASTVPASTETSVQVIRSFPDGKEFHMWRANTPWRTLPAGGVHEVKRTFTTAIGAARRYIYIEDQSFDAVNALFPSLVAACKRGVKVIVLIPSVGDPLDTPDPIPPVLNTAVQTGIVDRLSPSEQGNFALWQLSGIVVHAKLMLIDDEFVEIGSANFMDRSMQSTFQGDDSELTGAAVSTGSLISDLRVQLWAEHLRVTAAPALAEIRDLTRSLGLWRPTWGTGLSFPHSTSPLLFVGPAVVAAPATTNGARSASSR